MIQNKNYLLLLTTLWIVVSNTFSYDSSALAAKSTVNITKEKPSCSNQDLATLTTKLLRDLPAYSNRATQRARRLDRSVEVYSYMLLAGKPDFTPLPLKSWTDGATDGGRDGATDGGRDGATDGGRDGATDEGRDGATDGGRDGATDGGRDGATDKVDKSVNGTKGVEQVFFTTLERQYMKGKAVELQQFHRLFLTKTKSGWRMSMMYSQTGGYPKQKPPTPPRESSNSAVGQGIKTWLRDCRAGSVRF